MKRFLTYILAGMALVGTSCSDFLDTIPHDALSPSTTWQTEADAQKFLIGCYDGWADDTGILYWDCASDFGFNYHLHEGWRTIGNGGMTSSNQVANYYSFGMIRRCNDFLTNIEGIEFADAKKKDNMKGQVKTIRAYRYFLLNWLYGGVPIIDSYATGEEAQVPRNSVDEVKEHIYKDLDEAIPMLYKEPTARGYLAQGAALALKTRVALFYGDYQKAKDAAGQLMGLGIYQLDEDFMNLFNVAGQDSKEIIAACQADENLYSNWMIATMYNNADGGWSSMVPTQNLIDAYEMSNGLTKDEPGSGYDATHPFANRDPRMAMTVLYPGMEWEGGILNTLDKTIDGKKNPNYPADADNASKTALTWGKYLNPMSQYADMWSTNAQLIVFRYAEVLLSYAEAENELNGPSAEVYGLLNKVRNRVGMPDVDQAKYATKETLRELIRRERGVELAGEGLSFDDMRRWGLLETLNGRQEKDITGKVRYTRSVSKRDYLWPIPADEIEKNPALEQNPSW